MQSLRFLVGPLLCCAWATSAQAQTVEPLLDLSIVDRVHQVVPLGASGDRIALNAQSAENGEQVGPSSWLIRAGVYLANADASDLHVAWSAPEGEPIQELTASEDGAYVAWIHGNFDGGSPLLMSTGNERTRKVRGPHSNRTDGFVAGASKIFATLQEGRSLRQVSTRSGKLMPISVEGANAGSVFDSIYVRSPSGTEIGSCGIVGRRTRPTALRVGILDRTAGVLQTMVLGRNTISVTDGPDDRGTFPTCAVSDDGSTVGTLVRRGRRKSVLAVRNGQEVSVQVPRGAMHLASFSTDGRYALIGGGQHQESIYGTRRWVELSGMVAIADLQTGHVAQVRDLSSYSKRQNGATFVAGNTAVWAADGSSVAMAPHSGGLMVVSSQSGDVQFVRPPSPPPGFAFEKAPSVPIAYAETGDSVVFALRDSSEDVTVLHPYRVPVGTGAPRYLLSSSMRSFQSTVTSRDGSRTWLLPSSTCSSVYPQPLLRLQSGSLWAEPFVTPPEEDPYSQEGV